MLSVPYTSAASLLITTSQNVRVLWIRGEDNTHIFETVFEFHENISDQDIVFVHLPKIQSKSWPIGSLSLLSKRRNNQDLISLSCQAHHMLLCSSVRILSRNLPSQFGTWQHQINILKVTQSTVFFAGNVHLTIANKKRKSKNEEKNYICLWHHDVLPRGKSEEGDDLPSHTVVCHVQRLL